MLQAVKSKKDAQLFSEAKAQLINGLMMVKYEKNVSELVRKGSGDH